MAWWYAFVDRFSIPLAAKCKIKYPSGILWRGGRAVEGARLEFVYTVKRIEGSNPFLSASLSFHIVHFHS